MGGQGLTMLVADQAAEGAGEGFLAEMPVRRPGEAAEADAGARFGHAGEAEVEAVGQDSGHDQTAVVDCISGTQMGETVGEIGPSIDLGDQIGDADVGQHAVEAFVQRFCFRWPGLGDAAWLRAMRAAARPASSGRCPADWW